MPYAFLNSLIESESYSIINKQKGEGYSIVEVSSKDSEFTTQIIFYSVNGDVKAEDIEYVNNKLNEDLSVHLAVLLFSGEFSDKAKEISSNKGLDEKGRNSILGVHIHPTLAKRLICSYKSLLFEEKIIDKNRRILESRDIIFRELEFDNKLSEWLKNQSEKGLVINQIATSNIKEFADTLKLHINYMENANSTEEILEKNLNGILKFRKYGKKSGLITSDFEDSPNMVKNFSIELHENGFLSKNSDSNYVVKNHPVENRILQIIQKEKKVTVDELRKYFIVREKNKRIFEDVFLNILEYKGKIQRKGKNFILIDKEETYDSLKMEYNKYVITIEKQAFINFGHFYITKQKADKLIIISEFDNFIKTTFDELNTLKYSAESDNFLRKMFLTRKLIQIFNDDFKTAIEGAAKESDKIFEEIQRKKNEIIKDFDYVVKNGRQWSKLNLKNGKESIHEYLVYIANYNEFVEIYNKKFNEEELESIIKETSFDKTKFKFDKSSTDAYYFNIKLFELEKKKDILSDHTESIEKLIFKNKTQFEQINSMQSKLEHQLKAINISKKYKISYHVYQGLISADIEKDDSAEINEINLKLSEIEKISKNRVDEITDKLKTALSLLSYLESSMKKERKLINSIESNKEKINLIEKIFDIPELEDKVKNYKNKVLRIENEYGEMDSIDLEDNDEDPTFFIDKWNEVLNISELEIDQSWEDYKTDNKEFIKKIENTLNLLKNKPDSSIKEDLKNIRYLIDEFKEKNKAKLEETELTANQLMQKKNQISKKLNDVIIKELEPIDFKVINTVQSIKTKSKWVDYSKIKDLCLKKGMSEEDIENAFERLVSKGYLQKGFSLL